MKRPRFWKLALLLAVPLLFAVLPAVRSERHSWRPKTIIESPESPSSTLQFSPDGRYLCLNDCLNNYSPLRPPRFYEIDSGRWLQSPISNAARTPYLFNEIETPYFAGKSHFILDNRLYSFPQGKRLTVFPPNMRPLGELSDERTLLCQDTRDWKIYTWDYLSGKPPRLLASLPSPRPKDADRTFALLADNRTLLILDQVHRAHKFHLWFWDMEKKKLVFQAQAKSRVVQSTVIGICTLWNMRGELEGWNYKTGQRLGKLPAPSRLVEITNGPLIFWTQTISPDGTLLARAYGDGPVIRLRDSQSDKLLRTLEGHHGRIVDICFSPDGRTLASSSEDGTVKLWRIK